MAVFIVLTAGMFSVAAGAVATMQDVLDSFQSAQNHIADAAMSFRQASPGDALASLKNAKGDLESIQGLLASPGDALASLQNTKGDLEAVQGLLTGGSVADQLGKGLKAFDVKVQRCIKEIGAAALLVDPESSLKAKPATAVLNKIFSTAKLVRTSEQSVVKPILAGKMKGSEKLIIAPQGDPFNYKAGKLAKFKIYPPGYPDPDAKFPPPPAEPPSLTLKNLDICEALDETYPPKWTLSRDGRYYMLELMMGPKEGSSHFELDYNGQMTEQLVMNRGGAGASSLPLWFPGYMQPGTYQMSISVGGNYWWTDADGRHTGVLHPFPPTLVPGVTFPLKNVKTFANTIVKMFNKIAPVYMQTSGAGITSAVATCTASTETSVTLTFSARYGDFANGGNATVSMILSLSH